MFTKDEIVAKGFTKANTKYLVWLDAASAYCGQSDLKQDARRFSANYNELRTLSVIYRWGDPGNPDNGGFCSHRTVLHELGHAMGAVQSAAPHYNGGHCSDSGNDLMCTLPVAIPYSPDGGFYFDYGLDDYWDPAADPTSGSTAKLPWWTVNLSKFLCPAAGCSLPNDPGY